MSDTDTDGSFPRCPKCGVILLVGFMPGGFLGELQAKHGWKIGRFGQSVPEREWDAVVTGVLPTIARANGWNSAIEIIPEWLPVSRAT
ncbi:MAG: hypothetical protein ACREJM_06290 [Candidatus Saccharimonadales bacterium]